MLPIRTQNPQFRFPLLTIGLIAVNLGIFWNTQAGGPAALQRTSFEYGCVPRRLTTDHRITYLFRGDEPVAAVDRTAGTIRMFPPDDETSALARHLARLDDGAFDAPIRIDAPAVLRGRAPKTETELLERAVVLEPVEPKVPAWLSILTSMFLHAGWLHVLGNLWFLWLFGCGVEDVLGRVGYVPFYLLTGAVAAAAHVADDPVSVLPCVGASGAVSGVMGGFLLLFPRAQVLALGPLILGGLIPLPAFVFLGFYLIEQVVMSLQYADLAGGVAWWAHIGGFVAGMIAVKAFPVSGPWESAFGRRRPSRQRRFGYDYDPEGAARAPFDDVEERRRTRGY